MPPAAALDLLSGLTRDYAVLDANGELIASYDTLYFDTPGLDFFHSHRCGRRVRHKVRIRHYPDRRISFLDVKSRRSELQSTKICRAHEYGDNQMSPGDRAFVLQHTGAQRPVSAQVWTRFSRVTLLNFAGNERVTIDLDLRVDTETRSRSFGEIAILEVKQCPSSAQTPVMTALRSAGRRPGWASKYCVGIVSTRHGVRFNNLLPGFRALERGAA